MAGLTKEVIAERKAEAKAKEEAELKEVAEAKAKEEAEASAAVEKVTEVESPWHVVADQSDKDTQVEVCNIATGYQMPKAVFIRYRVEGKIAGGINLMQGLSVKKIQGTWKLQ